MGCGNLPGNTAHRISPIGAALAGEFLKAAAAPIGEYRRECAQQARHAQNSGVSRSAGTAPANTRSTDGGRRDPRP